MTPTPARQSWPSLADWPPTRFANWRAHSSLARLIDGAVAIAGGALIGVSLIDAVGSFWRSHVVIYPAPLERFAAAVLLPCWPWIVVSAWMVAGVPRHHPDARPQWRWRPAAWRRTIPWAVAFGVIVAVVVTGFVLGAAKGSLRILPGGVHQVATPGVNSAEWTTVSTAEYHEWAARLIRGDAFFATFGLAMVGFTAAMRLLRRRLAAAGL